MSINIALFNMQDIDMNDVNAVTQRLGEYFALYEKADLKPTVTGMAIALNGMSRQTLTAIAHDRPTGSAGYKTALPREVADSIKKAYKMLENMWETYMNSGKINPVSGIFLGKNNYGYQDKTEYVLTHLTSSRTTTILLTKSEYATSQATSRSDFQQATLTKTRATKRLSTFDFRL